MPMGKTSERKTNTRGSKEEGARRGKRRRRGCDTGTPCSLSLFYLARKKEKKKGSWMDKWIQRERKESG